MSEPEIVVNATPAVLAEAIAARLVTRIVDAQAARGEASVVLTGGGIGIGCLAALANSPARDAIDWPRLTVWWGDERFVPANDPERNERQAREALLDRVPVDPARVHAMAPSDGPDGNDPEAAAGRYAEELAAAARTSSADGSHADAGSPDVPAFDVLMLGVGPEGHVASLFPESPAMHETERTVVAVHGSPKPPPTRLTLTLPALNSAREVWFLVAGAEKAPAVKLGFTGGGAMQTPAAGVRGLNRTLWLVDHAAARELPVR